MDKKIAFIGSGNIGSSMIGGIIYCGTVKAGDLIACDKDENKLSELKFQHNIQTTTDETEAAKFADIIFICVEPRVVPDVCNTISKYLTNDKIIVSIAAGVAADNLKKWLGGFNNVIRTMPNLPILVGSGMSMICKSETVSEKDMNDIITLFETFGEAVVMEEEHIHTFVSLASSAPAFIFMLIEAMADSGVLMGLERKAAYKIAAQTVFGSSKMVLQTNQHPAELKDKVCTPGGITVEGVASLEATGFRNSMTQALKVCVEKSKEMSK